MLALPELAILIAEADVTENRRTCWQLLLVLRNGISDLAWVHAEYGAGSMAHVKWQRTRRRYDPRPMDPRAQGDRADLAPWKMCKRSTLGFPSSEKHRHHVHCPKNPALRALPSKRFFAIGNVRRLRRQKDWKTSTGSPSLGPFSPPESLRRPQVASFNLSVFVGNDGVSTANPAKSSIARREPRVSLAGRPRPRMDC